MNKPITPEKFKKIEDYLNGLINENKIPNYVMLLYKKGETKFLQKNGWLDIKNQIPIDFDSIFRIHSMTKPIVTVGLMLLFEEGKFKLDDPISKYLPEFEKMKVFLREENGEILTEDCKNRLTILHLLTHTSGISYGYPDDPVGKIYGVKMGFEKIKSLNIRGVSKIISTVPLRFQPGEHFRYGYSFEVLGSLIEVLSGQRLDIFLNEKIFQPLEMHNTGYFVHKDKQNKFSKVYSLNDKGIMNELISPYFTSLYQKDNLLFFGGDGLVSTIKDYLNFALMFLNKGKFKGKQLLKQESIELITKNHLENDSTIYDKAIVLKNVQNSQLEGYGQGLGVRVLVRNDIRLSSLGEHGWYGYAMTFYWVDPKQDLIGIFLTQLISGLGPKIIDFSKLMNLSYICLK
ncbi:MAG: beta-lactamase family protein [Asgard group archaeon]|nr:beta-lactamase family protein [Asgard group archaeon]